MKKYSRIALAVSVSIVCLLFNQRANALDCPVLNTIGLPTFSDVNLTSNTTLVCHSGYVSLVDDSLLVPRWVAYTLTGEHSMGCNERQNNFHADDALPKEHRATPDDYAKSGYDIGHQAPAQDFAWSVDEMSDSFSLANMAPQLPHLNRDGWEGLEQAVRDWSRTKGTVTIFVGPILANGEPTIGKNKVTVPTAFYKIVESGDDSLAFIMPQADVSKGDLKPWQVSVSDIEVKTGITFPVKGDKKAKPPLWTDDASGWRTAHKEACGK